MLIVAVALAWPAPTGGQGPDPALTPETPGLRDTQVTLVLNKDRKSRRFRATVMARKDGQLTILTAAHCLSADDRDGPALLLPAGGTAVEGKVVSVVRNPSYRPNQPRDVPGPDNAVARLRFEAVDGKPGLDALPALRPALGLSSRPYPGPSGQVVPVRMIDQGGVEHAVKAGNHNNPRWLEWGPGYRPIEGDSGGGVFVLNGMAEGRPRPILIGIIVGRDEKGGGASLVSRDMRWIADELDRSGPVKPPVGLPQ